MFKTATETWKKSTGDCKNKLGLTSFSETGGSDIRQTTETIHTFGNRKHIKIGLNFFLWKQTENKGVAETE
jgi:hypothetical protein